MISISKGIGDSFGVFLVPISSHFSWDRSSVTSIFSIYMISLGLGSLFSGILFDRFGAKFNYFFGTSLLVTGYYFSGYSKNLWQFYVLIGIFGGFGASLVGIVPSQSILSKWFSKNLSTVLSIAYAGQGLGVLIFAPICQIFITNFNWMRSYNIIGCLFIFIFVILFFLPWQKIESGNSNLKKNQYNSGLNNINLFEALTNKNFWIFFFIYFNTAIGIFGISLQVVAYLNYCGFSEIESAFYFGLLGILTFPGMLFTGIAADIWKKHFVSTFSYFLSFLGIFSLFLLQFYNNYFFLFLFIISFGLSAGARGPIITTLIARIFSGKSLASIYGASNLGQGIGAAFGAFLTGILYDYNSNYDSGFLICSIFILFGAILFWFIPEIKKI